jgi:hypothetical protein
MNFFRPELHPTLDFNQVDIPDAYTISRAVATLANDTAAAGTAKPEELEQIDAVVTKTRQLTSELVASRQRSERVLQFPQGAGITLENSGVLSLEETQIIRRSVGHYANVESDNDPGRPQVDARHLIKTYGLAPKRTVLRFGGMTALLRAGLKR